MIKLFGALTTGLLAMVAVGYLATRSKEQQYEDQQKLKSYAKTYKSGFLFYLKELFSAGPIEDEVHF